MTVEVNVIALVAFAVALLFAGFALGMMTTVYIQVRDWKRRSDELDRRKGP